MISPESFDQSEGNYCCGGTGVVVGISRLLIIIIHTCMNEMEGALAPAHENFPGEMRNDCNHT